MRYHALSIQQRNQVAVSDISQKEVAFRSKYNP